MGLVIYITTFTRYVHKKVDRNVFCNMYYVLSFECIIKMQMCIPLYHEKWKLLQNMKVAYIR